MSWLGVIVLVPVTIAAWEALKAVLRRVRRKANSAVSEGLFGGWL